MPSGLQSPLKEASGPFLVLPITPGAMMVICSALQFNFFRQHLKYGDKNTYYIIFGKTSKPKEEHKNHFQSYSCRLDLTLRNMLVGTLSSLFSHANFPIHPNKVDSI